MKGNRVNWQNPNFPERQITLSQWGKKKKKRELEKNKWEKLKHK